jgi:hypothetical protein
MPFSSGQSGNPRGRPPADKALSDLLRKELKRKGPDGRPNNLALMEGLIALARAGSIEAHKLIFDRIEGRASQALDITSGGEPIAPLTVLLKEVTDADADSPPET